MKTATGRREEVYRFFLSYFQDSLLSLFIRAFREFVTACFFESVQQKPRCWAGCRGLRTANVLAFSSEFPSACRVVDHRICGEGRPDGLRAWFVPSSQRSRIRFLQNNAMHSSAIEVALIKASKHWVWIIFHIWCISWLFLIIYTWFTNVLNFTVGRRSLPFL